MTDEMYRTLLNAFGTLVPLYGFHFSREMLIDKFSTFAYYGILVVLLIISVTLTTPFFGREKIQFLQLVGVAFFYAAVLFVALSELLISWLASVLTKRRGEKWVKELDYIYLAFGAAGIVMATSRLNVVDDKMTIPEFIGPFVRATPLVVRVIKTRAEINGWNKS